MVWFCTAFKSLNCTNSYWIEQPLQILIFSQRADKRSWAAVLMSLWGAWVDEIQWSLQLPRFIIRQHKYVSLMPLTICCWCSVSQIAVWIIYVSGDYVELWQGLVKANTCMLWRKTVYRKQIQLMPERIKSGHWCNNKVNMLWLFPLLSINDGRFTYIQLILLLMLSTEDSNIIYHNYFLNLRKYIYWR